MLRSLQRARERQTRVSTVSPARPQSHAPSTTTTIETNPNNDPSNSKPQWNSSKVYQPTKAPRSVFLDPNRPVENVVQHRVITSTSPTRSLNNTEVTTPVKVVRRPSPVIQEPSRIAPVYVQQPYQPYQTYQTYQTNTRLIRTDPEGID